MIIFLFIILQCILALFMAFHDWISIPPLNDIETLKRYHSAKERLGMSIINTALVLAPLVLTMLYYKTTVPIWAAFLIVTIYTLLTYGTIRAWWIPYLFGSSEEHKKGFVEYKRTHHFLPQRDNNVVPNTLHVILHLLVWVCLGFALYLLLKRVG